MKKYWKTVLVSLVIVTTIGAYYIQAAMASISGASYKIETTSGNKEELDNLILEATFESGGTYYPLYISKDGSNILRRPSIIEELVAEPVPVAFEKFIQEHRDFMRGKIYYPGNYYEDEARLIYTDFSRNPLTIQIDILDKLTNNSTSFEINAPAQANNSWMDVNDVYVDNGKIKILATGSLYNGGAEMHIFTVDENKKELVDDSIIAKSEQDMSSFVIYNEANKIQNENYYLYTLEKYMNPSRNAEPEIISNQVYLYNISTEEVEEFSMPSDLKPFVNSIVIQGIDVFIPIRSANGIEVNRYNIEKKQWNEPLFFNNPITLNDEEEPFIQLTNGKLYVVKRVSDGYSLFIGDLRTGESLYEGKIINENRENLDTDPLLFFHEVYSIN